MLDVIDRIRHRALRSLLTVLGVAIGVLVLVLLSATSEQIRGTTEKTLDYYSDNVTIVPEGDLSDFGGSNGSQFLPASKLDELAGLPGVGEVRAEIGFVLDEDAMMISVPPMVLGGVLCAEGDDQYWRASEGRVFTRHEGGVAVVGIDLVQMLGAEVGKPLTVQGREFEVVGILERAEVSTLDQAVFVPLQDAQAILADKMPDVFRDKIAAEDLIGQVRIYVKPGVSADELAELINDRIEGVVATGPSAMEEMLLGIIGMWRLVTGVAAVVAMLIGGMSIVNTMLMAVSEQTRDMGVKRALGASARRIVQDVLAESALLGAAGGIIGIMAGALLAALLNGMLRVEFGVRYFSVTGHVVLLAFGFATVVGAIAGLYPAWRVSRLDPVDALR